MFVIKACWSVKVGRKNKKGKVFLLFIRWEWLVVTVNDIVCRWFSISQLVNIGEDFCSKISTENTLTHDIYIISEQVVSIEREINQGKDVLDQIITTENNHTYLVFESNVWKLHLKQQFMIAPTVKTSNRSARKASIPPILSAVTRT